MKATMSKAWTKARIFAYVILLAVMTMVLLTGCNKQDSEDMPDEDILMAQQAAADEREERIKEVKKLDVLVDTGALKPEKNLVETYYDISTEAYEDMVAYRASTFGEDEIPTYIFIGKTLKDVDVSELPLELLGVAQSLPGTDAENMEIQASESNGYVMLAAAPNGIDVMEKFVQVTKVCDIQSADDILPLLRADLTQMKAANE